jgi:hypothetical protein
MLLCQLLSLRKYLFALVVVGTASAFLVEASNEI